MGFGEAHSCAGKRKVFSSELMLQSLKIINLKGSCFWLRENIEFYNENSNFGKTHFSLERVRGLTQATLDKEINARFLLNEHDDLRFSLHSYSVHVILLNLKRINKIYRKEKI